MILLLKLDDSENVIRFPVTDYEVLTFPNSNRTDMPTRARRAKAWRHKRGVSAIARSEQVARMMLAEVQ